mgnify:FL=1
MFSDLSLPEVQINIPRGDGSENFNRDNLPIFQAIKRLAPGRVTRQFAVERGGLSHWIKIDVKNGVQNMPIKDFAKNYEMLGIFKAKCE